MRRAGARQGSVEAGAIDFVLGSFEVLDLDGPIAASASRLAPPTLRTLDAVHVASAREFGPDLEALVTYDDRMIAAARANGLPVVSPGRGDATRPASSPRP